MMMKGDDMNAASISFNTAKGKYEGIIDGKVVVRNSKEMSVRNYLKKHFNASVQPMDFGTVNTNPETESFSINERFDFVSSLVNMVATGVTPSAVITGSGGLGKSFTVRKALENAGFQDSEDLSNYEVGETVSKNSFIVVKGYSTAKGLFRTLYENRDNVIVFDDCDSILKDMIAINLLKAALDSYDIRRITYNADIRDEDLPRSFLFNGSVIFISNMDQSKLDQAIRSRSFCVDLSMTTSQKVERMRALVDMEDFMPTFPKNYKIDAIELIDRFQNKAKEISLRTLIKITKIRSTNKNDWEKLAQYVLAN